MRHIIALVTLIKRVTEQRLLRAIEHRKDEREQGHRKEGINEHQTANTHINQQSLQFRSTYRLIFLDGAIAPAYGRFDGVALGYLEVWVVDQGEGDGEEEEGDGYWEEVDQARVWSDYVQAVQVAQPVLEDGYNWSFICIHSEILIDNEKKSLQKLKKT